MLQVFSNSMACGIKFYRENQNIESIKNSKETEKFTSVFYNLFDALNLKFPSEGIRNNSSDFKVPMFKY